MAIKTNPRYMNLLSLMNVFLFSMIFGLFTIDNRAILNISSVFIVSLSIYSIYKDRSNPIKSISLFLMGRKSLMLFLLWSIGCILFFTYENNITAALGQLLKDWRYPLVMLMFLIAFQKHSPEIKKTYILSAILTLSYIILVVPVIRYFKNNPQELYLQLRYGFAFYVVMLFPFAFTSAFMMREKTAKVSLFLLSFLSFVFLLYTGSRGGIASLLIEVLVIIFFVANSIKRFLLLMLCIVVTLGGGVTAAYNFFPQVKNKVEQSIKVTNITSGRDEIITQRYPLVMNEMKHKIFGIGYGNSTYDKYLWDHDAPRNMFVFNVGTNKYNLDEPLFITILYNVGFGGLILFLISMFVNLKEMIYSACMKRDIFNVSIIASFIGYFLIYCVFEKMFMEIYLIYTLLAFYMASNNNTKCHV